MTPRTLLTAACALAVLASTAVAAPAPKPEPASAEFIAAKRSLHAAVSAGTAQDILQVRARLAALSAANPGSATLHYWVALADWRVSPRFGDKEKPLLERYCMDGLQEADLALKLDPKFAETMALKASLLGLSLNFRPEAMMTIGPEIESTAKAALAAAPDNPRVLLLAGINTLNKPVFVGGGADRAMPLFTKSIERFSATSADTTNPDWGRDDAFIWAGRTAMKLEDYAAASNYFHQALEVTPQHAWVRNTLLPGAEKALAEAHATR